jgi:hypothetical protein
MAVIGLVIILLLAVPRCVWCALGLRKDDTEGELLDHYGIEMHASNPLTIGATAGEFALRSNCEVEKAADFLA